MSTERALETGYGIFGRPPPLTSFDRIDEMAAEGALEVGLDIFQGVPPSAAEIAQAKAEAELKTPEGRKRAAEAKRAEIRRKEMNWGTRVTVDRGNGWKPIWGTEEDEELRVYTLTDDHEHRFWGIKPIGMNIDEFWRKYDPEVRRYDDRQEETPVNPDAPVGPLIGEPPRTLPPKKATAKSRKPQKTPEIDPSHRVRKPTTRTKKPNNTRKSLAHQVDAGNLELESEMREMPIPPRVSGRATRTKTAGTASSTRQKQAKEAEGTTPSKQNQGRPATKAKAAAKDDTVPIKRPRGRPPIERKPNQKTPKQKKTPAVTGNARVTKSRKAEQPRPSTASTHQMRTRGKGPAEPLRLP